MPVTACRRPALLFDRSRSAARGARSLLHELLAELLRCLSPAWRGGLA
ncbi:MAG: hypothetical protein KIS83_09690 [Rubrivivax sp.]|nr:hypothetical protein [Rubrivivax sp.]